MSQPLRSISDGYLPVEVAGMGLLALHSRPDRNSSNAYNSMKKMCF